MCRFYLLLAGAVGKRQGISIPYPSPTPLLTSGGIRCGGAYLLPRAYRDIGSFIPVQTVCPHFDMTFGCFVFGLGSLAFQKITLGICLSFFIGGGIGCSFLRLRDVLLWSIVGITADRAISTISYSASPFQQCCRVEEYCKTALVQLVLQENGYPVQPKLLTIYIPTPVSAKMNDPTAVSANPTKDHSQTTRSRWYEQPIPQ